MKAKSLARLKVCLAQNYISVGNEFNAQLSGLPMGFPLSPLSDRIEKLILQSELWKKNIAFSFRYVDKILVGCGGTDRQMANYLDHLNDIHKNLKFTINWI